MPKPYPKRKYKKQKKGKYKVALPRTLFANNRVVRMRYVQTIEMVPTTVTTDRHLFSCNNLHVPSYSGGTGAHQPLLFDQYAQMYNHYAVLGSKLKVTAINLGGTTTGTSALTPWSVTVVDDTSSVTTVNTIMEQNNGSIGLLTSKNKGVLTSKFSPKSFFGVTDVGDNSRLTSLFSTASGPTEEAYFSIQVQSGDPDGVDGPYGIVGLVEIDYIVKLFEPKEIEQSIA